MVAKEPWHARIWECMTRDPHVRSRISGIIVYLVIIMQLASNRKYRLILLHCVCCSWNDISLKCASTRLAACCFLCRVQQAFECCVWIKFQCIFPLAEISSTSNCNEWQPARLSWFHVPFQYWTTNSANSYVRFICGGGGGGAWLGSTCKVYSPLIASSCGVCTECGPFEPDSPSSWWAVILSSGLLAQPRCCSSFDDQMIWSHPLSWPLLSCNLLNLRPVSMLELLLEVLPEVHSDRCTRSCLGHNGRQ